MNRQFDVVIEQDSEGYFVASVPTLPGCHTQAKSLDLLMERIREAIELCLDVQDVPPGTFGVHRGAENHHCSMTKLPSVTGKNSLQPYQNSAFK